MAGMKAIHIHPTDAAHVARLKKLILSRSVPRPETHPIKAVLQYL